MKEQVKREGKKCSYWRVINILAHLPALSRCSLLINWAWVSRVIANEKVLCKYSGCCLLFDSNIKHLKGQMGLGKAPLQQEWSVAFFRELACFAYPNGKLWNNSIWQTTLVLENVENGHVSGYCDWYQNLACTKLFTIEPQWPFCSTYSTIWSVLHVGYTNTNPSFFDVSFMLPRIPFSLPSNKLLFFKPNLNFISLHSHPQNKPN